MFGHNVWLVIVLIVFLRAGLNCKIADLLPSVSHGLVQKCRHMWFVVHVFRYC